MLRRLWHLLAWPGAEDDPAFLEEIRRRVATGCRVIGWVMAGVPLLMSLLVWLLGAAMPTPPGAAALVICVSALGGAALLAARIPGVLRHGRLLGWWLALLVAGCLSWSSILRAAEQPSILYLVNAQAAVVILIALLSLPFKPLHVLLLGLSIQAFYYLSYRLAVYSGIMAPVEEAGVNLVFLGMLTALSTAVAVNVYRQIHETYQSHRAQLQSAEQLRDAQCRVLLADNAASLGRLAAALSHELNNPLGALKSTIDTISGVLDNAASLTPEKREAVQRVQRQLCRNAREAVDRLQGTVGRMQRFTNLDRAEQVCLDLNALLGDVTEIVRDALETNVAFELDFAPLPPIEVRPQQLSAVFSALLQHAAETSGTGGRVKVRSRLAGGEVRIQIQDSGPGMTSEELAHALDPSFAVRDGRVAACNWTLFGARQFLRQHGGDILAESQPGQGTVFTLTLPYRAAS
jgi:signal transduction histidine kinase